LGHQIEHRTVERSFLLDGVDDDLRIPSHFVKPLVLVLRASTLVRAT
jgi:hypothetical protein